MSVIAERYSFRISTSSSGSISSAASVNPLSSAWNIVSSARLFLSWMSPPLMTLSASCGDTYRLSSLARSIAPLQDRVRRGRAENLDQLEIAGGEHRALGELAEADRAEGVVACLERNAQERPRHLQAGRRRRPSPGCRSRRARRLDRLVDDGVVQERRRPRVDVLAQHLPPALAAVVVDDPSQVGRRASPWLRAGSACWLPPARSTRTGSRTRCGADRAPRRRGAAAPSRW